MPDPRTVCVVLPWPDKRLHAHNTGHWRNKHAVVKSHRELAKARASRVMFSATSWPVVEILITAHMPDLRPRDPFNVAQMCKPYIDGIVDAKLILDDNHKTVKLGMVACVLDRENPRIEITITNREAKE